MNSDEHMLHEQYIAESVKLHGYKVKLHQVNTSEEDMYFDEKVTYLDPVYVNIIFQSDPIPRLKKLGWLLEGDANPYLAYITNYDDSENRVNITKDCIIEISSMIKIPEMVEDTRRLVVSQVNGSKIDPLFWECKLVPYRPKVDLQPTTPEYDDTRDGGDPDSTGTSYLKINL